MALAVGPDGKVFSGSSDRTVRVWSGVNGAQLHTLKGGMGAVHCVCALALGRDGTMYSGGYSIGDSRGNLKMW
jgi:WD40 repeat protein